MTRSPSTAARSARTSPGAEVYNDDVIRPLDNPIYAEGALAVLRGNSRPTVCHQAQRLRAAPLASTRGPALVFDDYPALKKAIDNPDLEVTGDHDPGAS